jgi:hypothetical protein
VALSGNIPALVDLTASVGNVTNSTGTCTLIHQPSASHHTTQVTRCVVTGGSLMAWLDLFAYEWLPDTSITLCSRSVPGRNSNLASINHGLPRTLRLLARSWGTRPSTPRVSSLTSPLDASSD